MLCWSIVLASIPTGDRGNLVGQVAAAVGLWHPAWQYLLRYFKRPERCTRAPRRAGTGLELAECCFETGGTSLSRCVGTSVPRIDRQSAPGWSGDAKLSSKEKRRKKRKKVSPARWSGRRRVGELDLGCLRKKPLCRGEIRSTRFS